MLPWEKKKKTTDVLLTMTDPITQASFKFQQVDGKAVEGHKAWFETALRAAVCLEWPLIYHRRRATPVFWRGGQLIMPPNIAIVNVIMQKVLHFKIMSGMRTRVWNLNMDTSNSENHFRKGTYANLTQCFQYSITQWEIFCGGGPANLFQY